MEYRPEEREVTAIVILIDRVIIIQTTVSIPEACREKYRTVINL